MAEVTVVKTGVRVRAPRLQGAGGWINTDRPLDLRALRGRVVVLDFWTFACVNCLHVIDELRPLEAKYPNEVVVIGIHSPKFAHEADHAAVVAAVDRLEIHHPVLDDPELTTWRQYAIKAWPTLVVIDPEGYVVAQAAGEGQVSALDAIIAELLHTNRPPKTGNAAVGDVSVRPTPPGLLHFPAKALVLPAARTGRDEDSLLIADAGRHAITELSLDGLARLVRAGRGDRGRADGPAKDAQFAEPNGLALLPCEVADAVGYDVLVADTANHLLRGLRLHDRVVTTVADLAGLDLTTVTGRVPGVMSPWDVAWWPDEDLAVVAAAGVHLLLSFDPRSGQVAILAGTTVEGLRDGPALDGWLAQPSGLSPEGDRMWFADAETSALRWLDGHRRLHTAVGEGLFDFGHVDGPAATARLQHPLDVAVLPDATIAIADTFNGAVRRFDPATELVTTLAGGLSEPSGLIIVGDQLLAVEAAAHRLTAVPMTRGSDAGEADASESPAGESDTGGSAFGGSASGGEPMQVARPVTDVGPGVVELRVAFTPAPGRVVDDRFGPATRLDVSASPPGLLVTGAGGSVDLHRTLRLASLAADGPSTGVLHVSAQAASCDHTPEVANPACYLARQDWGIPIRLTPDGRAELELVLLG